MIHMAMVKDVMFGKTMRKSYAKYEEILQIPNMLKIQKDSYQWFLEEGLREVFKDVGTITDFSGKLELSFLDYTMEDKPKYTIEECKERDATYAKPIKVRVRLRNTETDEIKEQEIFMGDFPVMTNGGTFVINGAERVIISQIVRSPGMYYGHEVDKADQHTYTATVIPYRGAWLEWGEVNWERKLSSSLNWPGEAESDFRDDVEETAVLAWDGQKLAIVQWSKNFSTCDVYVRIFEHDTLAYVGVHKEQDG